MIETKNLTKTFDNFTAVDSLDLKIETGEFFGLLGPNGAGKTTTISLLSTLLLPTKGEILIDGQKLTRNRPDLKRKRKTPVPPMVRRIMVEPKRHIVNITSWCGQTS